MGTREKVTLQKQIALLCIHPHSLKFVHKITGLLNSIINYFASSEKIEASL